MSIASDIINPKKSNIFRVLFLYVGQGEATLLVIPDNESYKYILIDSNSDEENNGINLASMLKDLNISKLDVFINTHPHNDHIKGLKDIYDEVGISEIWHSGHKPSKKHDDAYKEMLGVIKQIGLDNEYVLFGTNNENKIRKSDKKTEVIKQVGILQFFPLAPAEFVDEEINDEKPDVRYARIHENCSVIQFVINDEYNVLITGDSNKKAWSDHITDYHKDKLNSYIMSASHHGSRSFFKENEDDEDVYKKHIEYIKPKYLIISASKNNQFDHPHKDALQIYEEYVDSDSILFLGKNKESVIVDFIKGQEPKINFDKDLVKHYGYKSNDNDGGGNKSGINRYNVSRPSIDEKKFGNC